MSATAIPLALQAGLWGALAGAALLLGAALAWWFEVPQRLTAAVMAFGAGVLISALAFELMDEAWRRGGLPATGMGFVAGAAVYTVANVALSRRGARHRKRSARGHQPGAGQDAGSGTALAIGALLDGIPEAIVIGLSLLDGGRVSLAAVVAVFLSNVPEGLSSAAGMRRAGRGGAYVFGVWGAIALVQGLSSWAGYSLFADLSPGIVAATTAVAAGAVLAMVVDTMIPEAFDETHDAAGLITVAGFLCAFVLSKAGG